MKVTYFVKLSVASILILAGYVEAKSTQALVVKKGVDHQLAQDFTPSKQAVFNCVLKAVGANYEMKMRPMGRHFRELGEAPFDISFPVSSQYVLKSGEQLSAPLALEEWYWVTRSKLERPMNSNTSIAVIVGSEEESWLLASGVKNLMRVTGLNQLVRLFTSSRVDVLLIDRETLKQLALDMGLDITPYFFKFERYVSFSALFSATLINKRADFVKIFNRSIHSCSTEEVLLDSLQRVSLEAYARKVYLWLSSQSELSSLYAQKNLEIKSFDHLYIDSLEAKWLAPNSSLVKSVMERPLSKKLMSEALVRFEYVKEIIIFDRSGGLVASSGVTTDYYQGDEMKYSQTFSKNQNLFFDLLRFDESTGKFIAQVTMILTPPKSNQRSLAVTIGIDVSGYLAGQKQASK